YPSSEMKIKKESFALRCEVCHQVDCFDPTKNYCSRCQFVPHKQTKKINISRVSYLVYLLLNLSITTISYGLLQTFHPILIHESTFLFFFPMTVITTSLFLFNYKYLANKATLVRQIRVFYSTFFIALLLYGMYICFSVQLPHITLKKTIDSIVFFEYMSLGLGHIFGLPVLIFMIFINTCLKKFLYGELQTTQNKFAIKR
ncbi:MAG: hypothetical protein FD167_3292, partial [bacterium]